MSSFHAAAWPRHGAPVGGGPLVPGLVLGTYGSTGAAGWTRIGPSTIAQPSATVTNIIYVSDFLGNDLRDGSTPTFVDDGVTEQFALSSAASPVVNNIYTSPNGNHFTVAVSVTSQLTVQMTSRTGLPDASGTLTLCSPGCGGPGTGPATMAYTTAAPGIHGPVKTLIKGAGGTGPGLYDPDNNSRFTTGDGTGLGTQGNWRTAGSAAASFGLRGGKPDWLLLRMGDTFTGQALETAFSYTGGGSDNFGLGGFSEQEPLVVSAYDENFPSATNGPNVGARARPIIIVPSSSAAFAAGKPAGTEYLYYGRPGIQMQGGTRGHIAIMGIEFYAQQRDPGGGNYSGVGNTAGNVAITVPSGGTGFLIEDCRVRWFHGGINFSVGNFDVNIRRNQADHSYTADSDHGSGITADDIKSAGGAMAAGLNFEENVFDLNGYTDATFTAGDPFSRNAYIQWDTAFGNRRGNTSARSASEGFQFRSGGIIDNNFIYGGSFSFDVGHVEGDPPLTSSTVVTNNVVMFPQHITSPIPLGINFLNSNNVTSSGNIIAHKDPASGGAVYFARTDAIDGTTSFMNITGVGSGGTLGYWPCIGQSGHFTGGHGTSVSNYTIHVGAGGSIDDPSPLFVDDLAFSQNFLLGDVLTPVANYPSINTAGVSITAAGSGGTAGTYGTAGVGCRLLPSNSTVGVGPGVALTNFSGSMAGSGALATFDLNDFTGVTRVLNGGTGFYDATGTVPAGTNTIQNANNGGLSTYTSTITVYGAVPAAYNGTWNNVISSGNTITWSTGLVADPGPVTTPGHLIAYQIVNTGVAYQVGDVLTASPGGQAGLRIRVNSISALTGWQLTVASLNTAGVHGLTWTGNTIFNWPDDGPPAVAGTDAGGTHDSPGGVLGSGVANTWTGNTNCTTNGAQFTGVITSGALTSSSLLLGSIAIGQNLAGAGVTANTTITGGSGTAWTVSPSQSVTSTTMYSYVCSPTKVWSDPTRTVSTYAALHGQAATIDGYMAKALANAKWNWDPTWTANNGLNPYIRLGFQ